MPESLSRRHVIQGAALAAAAPAVLASGVAAAGPVATKGRIRQSLAFWCYHVAGDTWDIETMCRVAKDLGCQSIELCDHADWPTLKRHGLVCALANNGMPGRPFVKGFNNPRYHDEVIASTTRMIDVCAEAGFPAVIAFTGFKWRDAENPASGEISREEGADNCVAGFKKLIGHAEKRGVTLCLEHLNTRDASHPMKGHPGYQGDDVDEVADIVRRVGSAAAAPVRHLPRADHARRRDPSDRAVQGRHRTRPYRRESGPR